MTSFYSRHKLFFDDDTINQTTWYNHQKKYQVTKLDIYPQRNRKQKTKNKALFLFFSFWETKTKYSYPEVLIHLWASSSSSSSSSSFFFPLKFWNFDTFNRWIKVVSLFGLFIIKSFQIKNIKSNYIIQQDKIII